MRAITCTSKPELVAGLQVNDVAVGGDIVGVRVRVGEGGGTDGVIPVAVTVLVGV